MDRGAGPDAADRPALLRANLGAGESEALSLAIEIGAERLLVDERAARRVAGTLGLPVVGTLGVLLAAKRKGLIAELIRLARGGVGAVHRQLTRLAASDLVTVTRMGNQKH